MPNAIQPAQLLWQTDQTGQQVPVSKMFGDLYFSRENGLAESQHVFLAGNQLPQRLNDFYHLNSHDVFTIGELGFGTGLNVLATWQLWRQIRQQQAQESSIQNDHPKNHNRLHIISTEKFPLTKEDLSRALACWTELAELAQQLLDKYPPLVAGCHRLEFAEDNLSIDLWLGDAADSLAQVVSHTTVNAWYLDGFAPSYEHKQATDAQSLWAGKVLQEIQRLSGTGTTAATFSVAGIIKRGLAEHGFDITKTKGFGKKREMLAALYTISHSQQQTTANTSRLPATLTANNDCPNTALNIAVVGAGIAGLCTAYSFAKRGHQVTLFDKQPLAGASGNPRAMLAPKLTALHHVHEHLHSIGYMYATRFYQQFCGAVNDATPIYTQTGVLDLLKQSNVTPEQITTYPENFATMLTASQSTAMANIALPTCMQLPTAGLVNPKALASHLLAHHNIQLKQTHIKQINHLQSNIKKSNIEQDHTEKNNAKHINNHPQQQDKNQPTNKHKIILHTSEQQQVTADVVIICTAQHCHALHSRLPQPRTTRGQVSWFNSTKQQTKQQVEQQKLPSVPLKYGGYCAAFTEYDSACFLLGASFVRGTQNTDVTLAEHQQNQAKLATAIPALANIQVSEHWQGRASLRAQMPDYLPLVGRVDEQIYTLAAMGSKGFAYAPICAEVLAAQVLGEVLPLPATLVKRLNPLRFLGKQHA